MQGQTKKYKSESNVVQAVPSGKAPYKKRPRQSYVDKALASSRASSRAPEQKDFSFQYAAQISTAQTTASQIFCVNAVPSFTAVSATASNSRIGRVISGTHLSYTWYVNVTAQNYIPRIQAKVYYDKQSDGGTPSATDFKDTDDISGLRNLDNSDRFICLKTIEPVPVVCGSGAVVAATFMEEGSINLKGLETRFNLLTSGTTSMESGQIWIVTYGDVNVFTVSANSKFNTRYRFTDV